MSGRVQYSLEGTGVNYQLLVLISFKAHAVISSDDLSQV